MRFFGKTFSRMLFAVAVGIGLSGVTLSADAESKTTIRVDGFPDYDSHFKVVVPKFEKANKDLEVKYTINQHGDHHTKLTTNLATGKGAGDVVLVDVSRLGAFINSGGFVNLSQKPYDAEGLSSNFVPYSWAQGKGSDGKQYAIPIDIGPGVLYYRNDYLGIAKMSIEDVIKSWDSYIEYGKKLKKHKIALIGYAGDIAELIVTATVKEGEGLYFDKKGNPLFESERFVKAFTIAKKVRDAGLDLNITAWTNEWYEILRNGKVATQLSGAWLLGHLKNWIAKDSVGKWSASNLPNGIYGSWGGSFLVIPKQSKKPKEAWRFIQYLVSDKLQLQGLKGIAAFPANSNTYTNSMFKEEIPYLAGQKARLLFAEIAGKIKPVKPFKGDQIGRTIFLNTVEEIIRQGKPIKAALKEANEQMKRRTRRFRK